MSLFSSKLKYPIAFDNSEICTKTPFSTIMTFDVSNTSSMTSSQNQRLTDLSI